MGRVGDLIFVIAVLGGLAAWVRWGWLQWVRFPRGTSFLGWLSVSGFSLATLSALLQIGSGVYAQFVDVAFNDSKFLRIYFIGFWLAALGLILSVCGSLGDGPLRFKGPSLSAVLVVLWIWHAVGE
jgi:hypothetical protein